MGALHRARRRPHRRHWIRGISAWPVLMREFGFTPEHVVETAKAVESAEER
jgi:hypothetical protein